jgi:hypothetical protein
MLSVEDDEGLTRVGPGTVPPGVDNPRMYPQRPDWAAAPKGEDHWEYLCPLREAFQDVDAGAASTETMVQITAKATAEN